MSYKSDRYFFRLINDEKIPRKAKKYWIGEKQSKCKIRQRLRKVILTEIHTIYDGYGLSDHFCTKCGCSIYKTTGNMAEYPEIYVIERCARCNHIVAEADNSPFYHEIYCMMMWGCGLE